MNTERRRLPRLVRTFLPIMLALCVLIGASPASAGAAPESHDAASPMTTSVALPQITVKVPSLGDVSNAMNCGPAALAALVFQKSCNVLDAVGAGGSALANKFSGTVFEKMINSLLEGWERLMMWSLSWWITIPSPNLNGDGMQSIVNKVGSYTFYIQVFLLIGSLMVMAARMMMSEKGFVEEAEEHWKVLGRAVFAAALLGTLIALGTRVSDATSNWILTAAIGDPEKAGQLIKNMAAPAVLTGGLGHVVVGVIFLFGVIGAFVQLILLVIRQAMLIVVVVALPLAAAGSGTGVGSQAYQKLIAWTLAFLLFKPVGALVYMVAFTAARGDSAKNPHMMILGVILLCLAALILPALMRLIVPAVGSMGGAGGAAIGGAAGSIAGTAVTPGVSKAGGGGGSPLAGRGGGGPSGPSGPPSPPRGGGGQAALGPGKAGGAAAGASGAATAAGPVGAAVAGGAQMAGAAKRAGEGEAGGGAGAPPPNPTGNAAPAAASTRVPALASGTGEHRMAG